MNSEALFSKSCTPCRGGIPPLSSHQVKKYHRDTPEWTILDEDRRIERTFKFKNFAEAFAFVAASSASLKALPQTRRRPPKRGQVRKAGSVRRMKSKSSMN
jgi:hypothetical protein